MLDGSWMLDVVGFTGYYLVFIYQKWLKQSFSDGYPNKCTRINYHYVVMRSEWKADIDSQKKRNQMKCYDMVASIYRKD